MAQNNMLPYGWNCIKLGEIGQLLRGVSYRKEDSSEQMKDGLVPILRATNIQDEKLILDSELVYVSSKYVKSEQYLKPGDIVVCMSSGSKNLVGKTAQLFHDWEGSFGTFCAAIRPHLAVNAKFVGYYFLSPKYRQIIRKKSAGININNLKPSDIETIEIPVPPLPEQESIVAKIEELFMQLEAGTAALQRVQAGLKRYKASVLKSACEGRLVPQDPSDEPAEELLRRMGKSPLVNDNLQSLPDGWCWTRLGDLASHVTSGSRGWAKYYTSGGDLFLRVGNFNRLTTEIDLRDITQVNAPDTAEGNRTRLKLNDVLVTITADVGMVGIVDNNIMQKWTKAYINQHVGLVRLNNTDLAIYIAYALASEPLQNQFIEKQYGATKKGMNLDDLKSLQIHLPPLAEQQRIVAEVERRLSVVQELEQVVSANLLRASRLRQAILKRAFEGKLAAQNPEDEPAEALLSSPVATSNKETEKTFKQARLF